MAKALAHTVSVFLCLVIFVTTAFAQPKPPDARLLFGLGPSADTALDSPFARQANIRMLTSWFNGTEDLEWHREWKSSFIPKAYTSGYALHIVVFSDIPEVNLSTPYGPACGRPYPLSPQFLKDMKELAQIYNGKGKLYVTLFTEFQTYPCIDNQWIGAENYYRTLKDQYREAVQIFHTNAPNSQVSLGWGGWQTRWDDPYLGAGLSLFPYFQDIMDISDFNSFQAMASDSNVMDIPQMTEVLHTYGSGKVMLAHYKPDRGPQHVFENDLRIVLSEQYLDYLTEQGLFAFSFMDDKNLMANQAVYNAVANQINRHAASAFP